MAQVGAVIAATKPLSVLMAEKVAYVRAQAAFFRRSAAT